MVPFCSCRNWHAGKWSRSFCFWPVRCFFCDDHQCGWNGSSNGYTHSALFKFFSNWRKQSEDLYISCRANVWSGDLSRVTKLGPLNRSPHVMFRVRLIQRRFTCFKSQIKWRNPVLWISFHHDWTTMASLWLADVSIMHQWAIYEVSCHSAIWSCCQSYVDSRLSQSIPFGDRVDSVSDMWQILDCENPIDDQAHQTKVCQMQAIVRCCISIQDGRLHPGSSWYFGIQCHEPLTRYVKLRVCIRRECRGHFPRHRG